MPRQQAVYGKRSRAAINPADIFGSPQNLKDKTGETFEVVEVVEENDRPSVAGLKKCRVAASDRKALGERNGNAVLKPELPGTGKQKKERSARGKKGVKEKSDGQDSTRPELGNEQQTDPDVLEPSRQDLSQSAFAQQDVEDAAPDPPTPASEKTHDQAYDEAVRDKTIEVVQTPLKEMQQDDIAQIADEPKPQQCPPNPPNHPYIDHASSLLTLTAHDICSFSDWAEQLAEHFLLSKIAEASFGEVYRLSLQPDLSLDPSTTQLLRTSESVLKVIALTPPEASLPTSKRDRERALKKAANMSKPADVASEVKLLQRLSSIPGFTNFRDVRVLRGRPGGAFPSAWKDFNAAQKAAKKDISIFPDPARKSSYADDQLWAVVEMQDAGTDLERLLEKGECSSVWAVWDIFWQVVLALAKGEEAAEFEHRDLHLGNICVRGSSSFDDKLAETTKKLGFTGMEATLIDYTISRASMSPEEEDVAFIDLANDEYLFAGDSSQEYQYDIYRYMRSAVYYSSPLQDFPEEGLPGSAVSWEQFHPLTNLVWLHYVLYMLLEHISWPSAQKAPARKAKAAREEWKRANELEQILLAVQEILDPAAVGANGVGKAGDLVAVALDEGWLDEVDIVGQVAGAEDEEEEGDGAHELSKRLEELALEQAGACTGAEEQQRPQQQEVVQAESVAKKGAKTRRENYM